MTPFLPAGVWAIANGISTEKGLEDWMEKASWADGWTFRNPEFSERKTFAELQRFRRHASWFAIHGRLDWAIGAQADALILGNRSLPWEEIAATARKLSSTESSHAPRLQIGASVHDPQEVARAITIGVDFLVFGPVWETPAKQGFLEPRGLSKLTEICKTGLPVVAVGGIQTSEQAMDCMEAGAHAVAVLRAYDKPEFTQLR